MIGPSLNDMGFRLVRVSFGAGNRPTLQIMAEPLDGSPMTIEHCETVSHAVSALLDVEDPIPTAYMLEVTSPGIDRPLVSLDDYRRFAGFEARVELARPIEGRKRLRGRLLPPDAEGRVTVADESGNVAVPFADIARAKLLLTDELIEATEANRLPPPETAPKDTAATDTAITDTEADSASA